jgi:hypothetical protein
VLTPRRFVEVGGSSLARRVPGDSGGHQECREVTAAGGLKYPQGVSTEMAVWFPSPANWLQGVNARVARAEKVGDVIVGRTATGRVLRFVVDDVRDVRPQEVEALAQQRAGLALFPLISLGETVRVVSARYDWSGGNRTRDERRHGDAARRRRVDRARQDRLCRVTVRYAATQPLAGPVLLDVDRQLYPARWRHVWLRASSFRRSARRSSRQADRALLGDLPAPRLAGDVAGVALAGTDLVLTVTLSAESGAAWLRRSIALSQIRRRQGRTPARSRRRK